MDVTTIIFGIIIMAQFCFMVYQDIENRKERDRLTLKIKANDVYEYKAAIEEKEPDTEDTREQYLEIDDMEMSELLKAKDNI